MYAIVKKGFLILSVFLCSLCSFSQTKSFEGVFIKIAECYTCGGYYRFEFLNKHGDKKIFLAKDKDIVSVLKHDELKAKNLKKRYCVEYRSTSYEDPFIGDCFFRIGTDELLSLEEMDPDSSDLTDYEVVLKLKSVTGNKKDRLGFQYTFVQEKSGEEFLYWDSENQFKEYAENYINTIFRCKFRIDTEENGLNYNQVLLSMKPYKPEH